MEFKKKEGKPMDELKKIVAYDIFSFEEDKIESLLNELVSYKLKSRKVKLEVLRLED